jgi:hypothetical protein
VTVSLLVAAVGSVSGLLFVMGTSP